MNTATLRKSNASLCWIEVCANLWEWTLLVDGEEVARGGPAPKDTVAAAGIQALQRWAPGRAECFGRYGR